MKNMLSGHWTDHVLALLSPVYTINGQLLIFSFHIGYVTKYY